MPYPVIGVPPSAGAVHETVTERSPAVPDTPPGAPGVVQVVNVLVNGAASGRPTRSVTDVDTCTVYCVVIASDAVGTSVTVSRFGLSVTVAGTGTPPASTRTDEAFTVPGWTRSENATMTAFAGLTPVEPFAGVTPVTVGATTSAAGSRNSSTTVSVATPVVGGSTVAVTTRVPAGAVTGTVVVAMPAMSVIAVAVPPGQLNVTICAGTGTPAWVVTAACTPSVDDGVESSPKSIGAVTSICTAGAGGSVSWFSTWSGLPPA
ncbi:unannotated protein [freshwater metagenome]|uniref:Unannotated protein n=1 Tax=freshwater metagenome TaxID=449393 RepID=A0A6J6F2B5_9ZZZZ